MHVYSNAKYIMRYMYASIHINQRAMHTRIHEVTLKFARGENEEIHITKS